MRNSSTSTVYRGITTFTETTYQGRLRKRELRLTDKLASAYIDRECNSGVIIEILELLNNFEFRTQQKYNIDTEQIILFALFDMYRSENIQNLIIKILKLRYELIK